MSLRARSICCCSARWPPIPRRPVCFRALLMLSCCSRACSFCSLCAVLCWICYGETNVSRMGLRDFFNLYEFASVCDIPGFRAKRTNCEAILASFSNELSARPSVPVESILERYRLFVRDHAEFGHMVGKLKGEGRDATYPELDKDDGPFGVCDAAREFALQRLEADEAAAAAATAAAAEGAAAAAEGAALVAAT